MRPKDILKMSLFRPFILGFTESIVALWNVYIALIYGTMSLSRG
jgi:DHA1 family multidrug resistance protein-like MFS transporter